MGTYDRSFTTDLLDRRLRQGREPFPLFPHSNIIDSADPLDIKPPTNPTTPIIMTTDFHLFAEGTVCPVAGSAMTAKDHGIVVSF